MNWAEFWWLFIIAFAFGVLLGQRLEALKWREKGDHKYMNRMASGGRLYQVKREKP